MLLRTVGSQPVAGDLEFLGGIAERHEGKHPDQDSNGISIARLKSPDVEGLGIIAKEVPKIDSLNQHGGPFLPVKKSNRSQSIFDICLHRGRVRRSCY